MNAPEHVSNEAPKSLPEAEPERDLALERLIFFSDAIFAIAITLLALDIRLPPLPSNATDADLFNHLLELGPKYFSFSISFLAIGLYWFSHHRMFQSIARYDSILLVFNLLLLMCIVFIPFPSSVIGDYDDRTVNIFYALTLAITGLLSGGMWLYASVGGRLLSSKLDRPSFRFSLLRVFIAPILFLLSAVIALWLPSPARIMWYLIALVSIIIALLDPRSRRSGGPGS